VPSPAGPVNPVVARAAHQQSSVCRLLRMPGCLSSLVRFLLHGGGLLFSLGFGDCGHARLVLSDQVLVAIDLGLSNHRSAGHHLPLVDSALVVGLKNDPGRHTA